MVYFSLVALAIFWIKPFDDFTGNHIVVIRDQQVFDYHGYSQWNKYWEHTVKRANQWWLGWNAEVINLSPEALVSEKKSKTYDGL